MWLWILAGAGLLPYVVLPIVIRNTQRFHLQPRLRQLFSSFYPDAIAQYFASLDQPLTTEGFRQAFEAVLTDYPGLKLYMRFYVADQEKITALASVLIPEGSDPELPPKTMLELSSHFDNGTELCTNNRELSGAPIEPRSKTSRTFHPQTSPQALVQLHRHFSAHIKALPQLPVAGTEFEFVKHCLRQELVAQEQIGGLVLDRQREQYRPTWAGAFLMAWYAMWPLTVLRRVYHRQKARLWLRQVSI